MTELRTPTGKRFWSEQLSGSPYRIHREDILAIEQEAAQQERERLRAWHAQVRRDWHAYWEGKDHRYGRDFAAFLGERFRNDYEMPEPGDRLIAEPIDSRNDSQGR